MKITIQDGSTVRKGDKVRWYGAYSPYAVSYHTPLTVIGFTRLDKECGWMVNVRAEGLLVDGKPYTFGAGRSMLVPESHYQSYMRKVRAIRMIKGGRYEPKVINTDV